MIGCGVSISQVAARRPAAIPLTKTNFGLGVSSFFWFAQTYHYRNLVGQAQPAAGLAEDGVDARGRLKVPGTHMLFPSFRQGHTPIAGETVYNRVETSDPDVVFSVTAPNIYHSDFDYFENVTFTTIQSGGGKRWINFSYPRQPDMYVGAGHGWSTPSINVISLNSPPTFYAGETSGLGGAYYSDPREQVFSDLFIYYLSKYKEGRWMGSLGINEADQSNLSSPTTIANHCPQDRATIRYGNGARARLEVHSAGAGANDKITFSASDNGPYYDYLAMSQFYDPAKGDSWTAFGDMGNDVQIEVLAASGAGSVTLDWPTKLITVTPATGKTTVNDIIKQMSPWRPAGWAGGTPNPSGIKESNWRRYTTSGSGYDDSLVGSAPFTSTYAPEPNTAVLNIVVPDVPRDDSGNPLSDGTGKIAPFGPTHLSGGRTRLRGSENYRNIIDLHAATGIELYWNFPANSSPEFVQAVCDYAASKPNLVTHFEYANEEWNQNFPIAAQSAAKAWGTNLYGLKSANSYGGELAWLFKATQDMMTTARASYAAVGRPQNCRGVLAWQVGGGAIFDQFVGRPSYDKATLLGLIDELAYAHYIGGPEGYDSTSGIYVGGWAGGVGSYVPGVAYRKGTLLRDGAGDYFVTNKATTTSAPLPNADIDPATPATMVGPVVEYIKGKLRQNMQADADYARSLGKVPRAYEAGPHFMFSADAQGTALMRTWLASPQYARIVYPLYVLTWRDAFGEEAMDQQFEDNGSASAGDHPWGDQPYPEAPDAIRPHYVVNHLALQGLLPPYCDTKPTIGSPSAGSTVPVSAPSFYVGGKPVLVRFEIDGTLDSSADHVVDPLVPGAQNFALNVPLAYQGKTITPIYTIRSAAGLSIAARGDPSAPVAAPVTGEPETVGLVSRMAARPTDARIAGIDTLVRALKDAGIWGTKLKQLSILAAHVEQAAKLNWITDAFNLSASGGPTFTVDRGFTGNGAPGPETAQLDTGFSPAAQTTAGLIGLTDVSFGAWDLTATDAAAGSMGTADQAWFLINRFGNTNNSLLNLNDTNYHGVSGEAGGTGLTAVDRSSTGQLRQFKNGVLLGGAAVSSNGGTSAPAGNVLLLRAGSYSSHQMAAEFIGRSMTDAQHLALYNAINTFLGSIGALT